MATLATGNVEDALNILSSSATTFATTDIPEIEFERDLIRGLLNWSQGAISAMTERINTIASHAHKQGYLVFELRANRLLQALSHLSMNSLPIDSPPYRAFPALIYGKVMA